MINRLRILPILLCLIVAISSCTTSKQTDLLQDIAKEYPAATPGDYKIIPGDLLSITVYTLDEKTEELYREYTPRKRWVDRWDRTNADINNQRYIEGIRDVRSTAVYADGTINFPYIGKLYVEGYTTREVQVIISEKLGEVSEGTTANVSLFNQYFSILGETGAARIVMPQTQISIFQALSLASHVPNTADRSKVSIIRQTADGTIFKTFDLRSKDLVNSDFYYIQANDVIYIPQSGRKFLGAPTSLLGLVGILSSIAGVIVFAFRII